MIRYVKILSTFPFRSSSKRVERIGDDSDSWGIVLEEICCESVILSAGVGHSISFELDLVEKTGARVHLFDPSPTGISTMRTLAQHKAMRQIQFIPKALAGSSGQIYLREPDDAIEGSWKAESSSGGKVTIKAEAISVSDYCIENKITSVDLLKLDIEGAEYDVIDDILKAKISIKQICLEFHSKAQIGITQTYLHVFWYAFKLFLYGYRIAYLTKSDFTWIKNK